ncbi:thiamine-phosphate pyrophosphorylase [Peptostreptococcaceae bacterium pGA-8]|nr:thiamine-phosphate pyrophosphorylase [Peptostreptococcaceae bacterium pGA-8]
MNTFTNEHRKNSIKNSLRLYGIIGSDNVNVPLLDAAEEALRGGITMLQLREKTLPIEECIWEGRALKSLCVRYGVPLIINDNVEVAKEVGADGIHLGVGDPDINAARRILGQNAIIGASAHNIREAVEAERKGADYLGVGAAFGSGSKGNAVSLSGLQIYQEISSRVSIPIVAIGGITSANLMKLRGLGISGIALISAIFGTENIEVETARFAQLVKEFLD